jgi:cell surface protein SprA
LASGYGKYSQSVLIPSFLAAYTKTSPYTIALTKESNGNVKNNPFSGYLPKPNWRLTYTGLSKVPFLSDIFTSITLTHAYSGTLSMNGFSSALNYEDPLHRGTPGFIDSVSGNFIPFFLVPNITMQEQFSPLIGINLTTRKLLTLRFEYKRSRQLSFSLVDYQLSETNSTEWTFGAGWKKKGLKLPFELPFMNGKKLQNDITFKLDLSLRDDLTSNSTLDQSNSFPTGGQKMVIIQPSIDYVMNNRINVKLFFDQRRSTPYVSTSPPTIITRTGIQVRISLAK